MDNYKTDECCARFNPEPWDEKTLKWENRFVKDRVTSFLHVPLNLGAVMKLNAGAIKAAKAIPDTMQVLGRLRRQFGYFQ